MIFLEGEATWKMKYCFIINPVSGRDRTRKEFLDNLQHLQVEYQVYETKCSGDAQNIAREICRQTAEDGEKVRIFACGGDGTVSQVINGAYGFDNVEIGAVPLGTGNDFIRNFGTVESFIDIARCIDSPSRECDLIRYSACVEAGSREGFCMNMFNIGLDCNIVELTESIKKLPLIKGPLAYMVSVFVNLIKRKGANLRVSYDDGFVHEGKLMLISIANGCYCGGGIKGLPKAVTDDGYFDVSLIDYVTRRDFIQLFPLYAKGVHLDSPKVIAKDIISYRHEKSLKIEALERSLKLCVDGEIFECSSVDFDIIDKGFRFIVPA